MLGALLIHDVVPSPSFIGEQPVLAYSIFVAFFLAHFMMIGMQAFCLRLFVLVTRVPMYRLAAVILAYCAIGVFALNNIVFDIWTLFIFGVVGYVMRVLGFPLAPMILGVVLGGIAEVNLSRAWAISNDLTIFLTRPWSLFFIIIAAFSAAFPWYQKWQGRKHWTLAFIPAAQSMAVSLPLFMMVGVVTAAAGRRIAADPRPVHAVAALEERLATAATAGAPASRVIRGKTDQPEIAPGESGPLFDQGPGRRRWIGVGRSVRGGPNSATEPIRASISIGRPRSRSCSIEVRWAPTAAAPSMRFSTSMAKRTPRASPMAWASSIMARARARVSGSLADVLPGWRRSKR